MAILLIRHGETPGNRDRVLQVPETPLSDVGRLQAARLAERLSDHGVSRILSSDLARAQMTADALSRSTGVPVELDPLLQERNFGDLRGCRYADLTEDPFGLDYSPPGGESWPEFHGRVDRAWGRILAAAEQASGDLAVVTHGLVLHSIVTHHVEWPGQATGGGQSGLPLQFPNTALTIVEAGEPWQVSLLGCAAHLDDDEHGGATGLSGL